MIRRTANISLSRIRTGIREHGFSFHLDQSKKNPVVLSGAANLLARNPTSRRRGTSMSFWSSHWTHTCTTSIRDVCPGGPLYVEIREKQSVPFTGNVYMDRLRRLLSLREPEAFGAPGISRMWLNARARIYPAQTLRYIGWISLLRISAPEARFVVAGIPHSARLRYTRCVPTGGRCARAT